MARTDLVLWLAGAKYGNLEDVLLISGATALLEFGGYCVLVLRVKGWKRFEPVCTLIQAGGQVGLILTTDLSTLHSVVLFGLYSGLLYSLPYLVLNQIGFARPSLFARRGTEPST